MSIEKYILFSLLTIENVFVQLRHNQTQQLQLLGIKAMYLGKRVVKARSFVSGIDPKQLVKLSETEKLILVQRLRMSIPGTDSYKLITDKLIEGHIGLTISIVGRYANYLPKKTDDMLGVGLLALTEAVNDYQEAAKDNNITPYIVSCIHGKIANYTKVNYSVVIKTRYQIDKEVKAEKDKETTEKQETTEYCSFEEMKDIEPTVVDSDRLLFEFDEKLLSLNLTRFETLVFKYLSQGWSQQEIATEMGFTRQRICQVRAELLQKLEPYYYKRVPKELQT